MKKKDGFYLKMGLSVVVILGVISFMAYEELNGKQTVEGIKSFEIEYPLDFSGQTNSNSNASILCTVKQTTYGIDSTGQTVLTEQSKGLSGNPLLSLTTSSGVKMAGFVIQPKIFCANTFNDDNLSNPERFTFVVSDASLFIQVLSTDKNGSKLTTYGSSFVTKQIEIPIGGSEKSLGSVGVYASDIEEDLQDGSYATTNQFEIRGNLEVYWKGFSGVKYTIPIKFGDITSYSNNRIEKGSDGTTVFTGDDIDGDGIKDIHDGCKTQPENYNGFEDGDGCPDIKPTTEPTPNPTDDSNTEPITQSSCNSSDRTWIVNGSGDDKCATANKVIVDGKSVTCNVFDLSKKICIDPVPDTKPVETSDDSISGLILWNIDVIGTDSSFAFLAKDDPSPFRFVLPLELIGTDSGGAKKSLSKITATPMLLMSGIQLHKLTSTVDENLKFDVYVGISENGQLPSWKKVISGVELDGFIKTSGASHENGIPLGSFTVTTQQIEGVIDTNTVALGETKDLYFRINISGTGNYVDIQVNSNGLTNHRIKVNSESPDSQGNLQNGLGFQWTNLQLSRGGGSGDNSTNEPTNAQECNALDGNGINYEWINNTCIPVINKNTKDTCESSGGTWNSESSICIAGKDPKPTNGGMCVLDSGAGDSNGDGVICQICTDDASGIGGFPCDEPYRIDYCNNTTKCGSDEGGNDPPSCTDLFADLSNGCKEPTNGTCPDGFEPFVKGVELQCNPTTVEKPNKGECPDLPNLLSLSDDACVIFTENPDTEVTNNDVCPSGNCNQDIIEEPFTMGLVVGFVLLISGIGIYAYKRKH